MDAFSQMSTFEPFPTGDISRVVKKRLFILWFLLLIGRNYQTVI